MSNLEARDTDTSHLHPVFREKAANVLARCEQDGLPFRMFEGFRTPQRQRYLYSKGRTIPGDKVTNAQAWQSYHQYGVAADFVLFIDGNWSWDDKGARAKWWARLHEIGKENGLERLGFESPHLQLIGLTTARLGDGHYPEGGDMSWAENLEKSIISWSGTQAPPPIPDLIPQRPPVEDSTPSSVPDDIPRPSTKDWHRHFGGLEYRYDARGIYLRDVHGGTVPLRTPGKPTTCEAIWKLCGEHILAASKKYGVSPELIMMTIATESAFAKKHGFSGPVTFRWEAHVSVEDVQPNHQGDYSAGPMQTLATTARWVIRQQHLDYEPFVVAPDYKQRPAPPETHPLYDLKTNIDIGTAEIKQRWATTQDDPVMVSATFNAGGIYESSQNRWHLRTYGDHLDRAAEWYGDACAVVAATRG
jgi:peptidoglycan LD-endopeptidase CwlK